MTFVVTIMIVLCITTLPTTRSESLDVHCAILNKKFSIIDSGTTELINLRASCR